MNRTSLMQAAALLSLVVSGCAVTPMNQAMPKEMAGSLATTDVIVGISQSEVNPTIIVQNSSAVSGQFGLIGALVGSAVDAGVNESRSTKAEETVRPVRSALIDYNFDQRFSGAVTQALPATAASLGTAKQFFVKDVNDKYYERVYTASTADAVMFVNADYMFTPDFANLRTGIRALLYSRKSAPAKGAPLALENAAYRATIIVNAPLPAPGADGPANAALWAADGGRLARAALQDGIRNAIGTLLSDLASPDYTALAAGEVTKADGLAARTVQRSADGMTVRREADGALYVLLAADRQVATQ
ncbi:MAG TPA: hypothetical protein VM074_10060 [Solimonas sp.]|nr:hypothetical protein [Solimonas sp.]